MSAFRVISEVSFHVNSRAETEFRSTGPTKPHVPYSLMMLKINRFTLLKIGPYCPQIPFPSRSSLQLEDKGKVSFGYVSL